MIIRAMDIYIYIYHWRKNLLDHSSLLHTLFFEFFEKKLKRKEIYI